MLTVYVVTERAGREIAGRASPGTGRLITLRSDDARTEDALRRGEIRRPGDHTPPPVNARPAPTSAETRPILKRKKSR